MTTTTATAAARVGGRLTQDGSSGFPAVPGRYHLDAGWASPWSQRVVLELEVNGLTDVISVSYVDAIASAPTLWDTKTNRVVSNDHRTLAIDIATQFPGFRYPGIDTYPVGHRDEIEELDRWVGPSVNVGLERAGGDGPVAARARDDLHAAFRRLDVRLIDGGFLVGRGLTEADIRLWVSLARYDVQRVDERLGPPLTSYPHLARYAAYLAELPAFRATIPPTDVALATKED
jgi:putative glutathione S-transferase